MARTVAGLDLIRFTAAFMVAWYHLAYWSWHFPKSTTARVLDGAARFESLAVWARWGWVGVEIFFVLSGFVIAFTAQSKSARAFLRSRFLRLYPAAWVCAVISVIWLVAYSVYPAEELPNRIVRTVLISPAGPWVDGVYWTLGVELVFYALVFAVLCFSSFSRLPLVFAVMGVLSSAFWFASMAGVDIEHDGVLSLLPFGCFFAIGGFIWLATTTQLKMWQRSAFALALVAGALEIYMVPIVSPATAGNPFVPVVLWLIAVALIIVSAFKADLINAFLAPYARAIRMTGLATYPLYLLHNTTGPGLIRLLVGIGLPPYMALSLAMIGVIALSYFVAALIEPTMRDWTERVLAFAQVRRTVATPS